MSKYAALWQYVQKDGRVSFQLSFSEIQVIVGLPRDEALAEGRHNAFDLGSDLTAEAAELVTR
jgi:hypothetical protein